MMQHCKHNNRAGRFLAPLIAGLAIFLGACDAQRPLGDDEVGDDQEFKVEIISPTNGTGYTVGDDVTVTVRATDDRPVVKVDGYHNEGSNLDVWFDKVEGSQDDNLYTLVWQNVPAGDFILHAVGTNADNVTMDSNDVTIRVNAVNNNRPPTCRMTWPQPPGPVSFWPGLTVGLRADGEDPDGSIVKVEFYEGTQWLGAVTSRTSQEPQWSNQFYLERTYSGTGTHTVHAVCTDNQGAFTGSAPVTFTVSAPEPLAIIGFQVPSPVTVGQQASASWQTTGIVVNSVVTGACWITGGPFGTFNIPSNATVNGATQVTASQVGTFQIILHCRRGTEEITAGHTLVVNPVNSNTPPNCTITSPANGATFTVSTGGTVSVPFTGTATDTSGTVSYVEFYRNNILIETDFSGPYALQNSMVLGAGTYSLKMKCYDNEGASSEQIVTITVNQASTGTVDISANPTSLPSPGTTNLTITATGVSSSCVGSWGWSSTQTGTFTVTLPNVSVPLTRTFTVTCGTASDSVTVNVATPFNCLYTTARFNEIDLAGVTSCTAYNKLGEGMASPAPSTVITVIGACAIKCSKPNSGGLNVTPSSCSGKWFENDSEAPAEWTTGACANMPGHDPALPQAGCTHDANCASPITCTSWPSTAACWPNQTGATHRNVSDGSEEIIPMDEVIMEEVQLTP